MKHFLFLLTLANIVLTIRSNEQTPSNNQSDKQLPSLNEELFKSLNSNSSVAIENQKNLNFENGPGIQVKNLDRKEVTDKSKTNTSKLYHKDIKVISNGSEKESVPGPPNKQLSQSLGRCSTPFGRMAVGQTILWMSCRKITCQSERGFPYLLEQKCPPLPKSLPAGCRVVQPSQSLPYPHCCPNPTCTKATSKVTKKPTLISKERIKAAQQEVQDRKVGSTVLEISPETNSNEDNETLLFLDTYPTHRYEEYSIEKENTNRTIKNPERREQDISQLINEKNKNFILQNIFDKKVTIENSKKVKRDQMTPNSENEIVDREKVIESRPQYLKLFAILKESARKKKLLKNLKNDKLIPDKLNNDEKITISMISDAIARGLDSLPDVNSSKSNSNDNLIEFTYIGMNPPLIEVNNSNIMFYDPDGKLIEEKDKQNERKRRNTKYLKDNKATETRGKPVFYIPWREKAGLAAQPSSPVEVTTSDSTIENTTDTLEITTNSRRGREFQKTTTAVPTTETVKTVPLQRSRSRMVVPRFRHARINKKNQTASNKPINRKITKYELNKRLNKRRRIVNDDKNIKVNSTLENEQQSLPEPKGLIGRKVASSDAKVTRTSKQPTQSKKNISSNKNDTQKKLKRMRTLRQKMRQRMRKIDDKETTTEAITEITEEAKIENIEKDDVTKVPELLKETTTVPTVVTEKSTTKKPENEIKTVRLSTRLRSPRRKVSARLNRQNNRVNNNKVKKNQNLENLLSAKGEEIEVESNTIEDIDTSKSKLSNTLLTSRKRPSLAHRARLLNIIRARKKEQQKHRAKVIPKVETIVETTTVSDLKVESREKPTKKQNKEKLPKPKVRANKVTPSQSLRQRLRERIAKRRKNNKTQVTKTPVHTTIENPEPEVSKKTDTASIIHPKPKAVTIKPKKLIIKSSLVTKTPETVLKADNSQKIENTPDLTSKKDAIGADVVKTSLPVVTIPSVVHHPVATEAPILHQPTITQAPKVHKVIVPKAPVVNQPIHHLINRPTVPKSHPPKIQSHVKIQNEYHPHQNRKTVTKENTPTTKDPFDEFLNHDDDFKEFNTEYEPPNFDFPEFEYKEPSYVTEYKNKNKDNFQQPKASVRSSSPKQKIPKGAEVKEEEFIVQGPSGVPIKVKTVSFHTSSSSVRNENVKNRSQHFKSNPLD